MYPVLKPSADIKKVVIKFKKFIIYISVYTGNERSTAERNLHKTSSHRARKLSSYDP
jgi:hypothetical protein